MKSLKHISLIPFIPLIACISLIFSCQKQIKVDLPDVKQKIVVDGRIEPGVPPRVVEF